MKTWAYSWLVYPLLYSVAAVIGTVKPKVRDTLRLRAWKDFLSLRLNAGQPIEYWIHVASAGELEYAVPLLKELELLGKRVLVTYYSISAKKAVEQLPQAFPNVSLVVPLPHDGLGLMREFVALVRRQGVRRLLLMKYELWPGLLWECNAKGIKVVLVDALKPSWFHRRLLHKLDGICSGYEFEVENLQHRCVKVVGDTRVERVLERLEASEARLSEIIPPRLRAALENQPLLVCGSMWPPDTNLLLSALRAFQNNGGKANVIWVPHELEVTEGERVRSEFVKLGYRAISYEDVDQALKSDLSPGPLAVIVMKKGILAELYRLGRAAYVGGGFGKGIHSVWEPALMGAKVACGPRTERSPESYELSSSSLLRRVSRPEELEKWFAEVLRSDFEDAGPRLKDLVGRHVGASKRIIQICEEL